MTIAMDEVMKVIQRYAPRDFAPKVGMILGSGLSGLAEQIESPASVPYQAIPGLQTSTVAGHASLLVMGRINSVPVVCLRGRLHPYEGDLFESIRTLIYIIRHLGCNTLIITCAVGSMLMDVPPGEVMMITDHINFQGCNPLVGKIDESAGSRFVSMNDAYDLGLQDQMNAAARKLNIPLASGVYISTLGPSFETPAEIRAFKQWGADVVGMSVAPEVIVARQCGLNVVCLAAISNYAAGLTKEKMTHEATLQQAGTASHKMTKLVAEFLKDFK